MANMSSQTVPQTSDSGVRFLSSYPVITTAILVLAATYPIFCILTSPVKTIPGPLLAKISNVWRVLLVWRRSAEQTHRKLHAKYGPAVALGPNMVSINDPQMIKVIYSRKELLRKSDFYAVNDLNVNGRRVENVFSTRNEEMNTKVMKPALRLFAMNNVLKYEALMDKTIDYFLKCLSKRFVDGANAGKTCDMDNWLHYCAWDIVGETTFSERIGFLEQGRDVDNMLAIGYSAMDYFSVIGMMPHLDLVLDKNPVYRLGPPFFGPVVAFALKRLENRRNGLDSHDSTSSPDFLDGFLDAHRTDPETVNEDILLAYMMVNVAAGSDTVATELRSCLYHLARNPTALKRLQKELDESKTEAPVSWSKCQRLPYLDACVHEGIRLAPGISLPLERVVGPNGLTLLDGKFLAPGVIVGCNPWVMNRHEGVFGKDADEFVPERWLRRSTETTAEHEARVSLMRETDLTFGYGKRMCAGRSIALVEIYKVVASLCQVYNVEIAPNGRQFKTINSWFLRQTGLDVRLTKRTAALDIPQPASSLQTSSTKKGGNFFKVQSVDASYWDVYLEARPKYEKNDFYSLIWDYHASQRHSSNPRFEVAHDIGTGPGQVAVQLASRFRTVVASDNNATHLEIARQRTKAVNNIVFEQHSAEEVGNAHELGTADFLCAAECMPLINAEKALASFSRLLRPGGTLAIWFYGRPHFFSAKNPSATSASQAVVQKTFGEIVDMSFRRVISAAPGPMKAGFELSADRMDSWLDDISFSPSQWSKVQRRKWNSDAYMSFIGQDALDRPIRISSAVREQEKVQLESNRDFWAEEWNIDGVKQFVRVLLPAFKADDPALEMRIEKKWSELEDALGGRDVTWKVTWPVVLILATRA